MSLYGQGRTIRSHHHPAEKDAMNPVSSPLTDSHCATIDCTLQRIYDLEQLLAKVERCGLPCESIREELQARKSRLEAYKREFFPNNH